LKIYKGYDNSKIVVININLLIFLRIFINNSYSVYTLITQKLFVWIKVKKKKSSAYIILKRVGSEFKKKKQESK